MIEQICAYLAIYNFRKDLKHETEKPWNTLYYVCGVLLCVDESVCAAVGGFAGDAEESVPESCGGGDCACHDCEGAGKDTVSHGAGECCEESRISFDSVGSWNDRDSV